MRQQTPLLNPPPSKEPDQCLPPYQNEKKNPRLLFSPVCCAILPLQKHGVTRDHTALMLHRMLFRAYTPDAKKASRVLKPAAKSPTMSQPKCQTGGTEKLNTFGHIPSPSGSQLTAQETLEAAKSPYSLWKEVPYQKMVFLKQ